MVSANVVKGIVDGNVARMIGGIVSKVMHRD